MKKKVYELLNRLYGITMTAAFFAGGLPLIPFVLALILGGSAGEAIAVFLYKSYYPWVILLASVSVLIGLVAMYLGKQSAFSVKDITGDKKNS